MFPFLRIGQFLVHMSGLTLLAGLWVAITIIAKEAFHLNSGKLFTRQLGKVAGESGRCEK